MQPLQYDLRDLAAKDNSIAQHQATFMQPLQCDLQRLSCKTQKNYAQRCRKLELQNRISTPKQRKDNFEAIFQRIFKRKITSAKLRQSADKSLSQPGCSHSNTIYNLQLQKTIVLRMQPRHEATPAAPVAHTRYLSSSPAATLRGKTHGFVLRLPPQNIAHATSCSHSNAIWHHSVKKRIELRTQEQALLQNT